MFVDLWTQIVYKTARNPALQPNPMRFSSLLIVAIIAVCFSLRVDAGGETSITANQARRALGDYVQSVQLGTTEPTARRNCPAMCAQIYGAEGHRGVPCPELCANLGASTGVDDNKACLASDWPCIEEYMAGVVANDHFRI